MPLRIRLARPSTRRHAPRYNIVLTRDRTARDSKPLEVLGTYNPTPQMPLSSHTAPSSTELRKVKDPLTGVEREVEMPRRFKDVQLDITRTKYWLGVGAQASEPVVRLLGLIGLVEKPTK